MVLLRLAVVLALAIPACTVADAESDLAPAGPVASGKGDAGCPIIQASIGVTSPQEFICAPVSSRAALEMNDVNRFWGSRVALCGCGPDQPECSNATAMAGGWIYASNEFIEGLRSSGSNMPTQYILAHEFGHEIQGVIGIPPIEQVKELQADCFAGYYLGSLACRGLVSEADVRTTLNTACVIADGTGDPIKDLRTHGTCEQRSNSVAAGMRGYLASRSALVACSL
jgi:hypothetical protein